MHRQLFPQFHRRSLVTQSSDKKVHSLFGVLIANGVLFVSIHGATLIQKLFYRLTAIAKVATFLAQALLGQDKNWRANSKIGQAEFRRES
jgi:hypothetical protein